jgi:hypothetical protein
MPRECLKAAELPGERTWRLAFGTRYPVDREPGPISSVHPEALPSRGLAAKSLGAE